MSKHDIFFQLTVATLNGRNTENVALHAEEARNHALGHVTILHRLMVEKTAKTSEQQLNQDHVMVSLAQVCLRNAQTILGLKTKCVQIYQ